MHASLPSFTLFSSLAGKQLIVGVFGLTNPMPSDARRAFAARLWVESRLDGAGAASRDTRPGGWGPPGDPLGFRPIAMGYFQSIVGYCGV